ncbi:MAG: stage II sporulation protein P [Gallintestinimicrobium sp.]
MIYHTHSQETFADSIPGNAQTGIMGVGEVLAEILRKQYGYNVMHHMGQYDVEKGIMPIPIPFRRWKRF